MSDELTPDQTLAAEYVLGLLQGEELLMARGRLAREPELAADVAFWEQRLAPMLDELGGAQPSPELLERIMAEAKTDSDAEVIALQDRVRLWQRVAAGSAVAALAALSLFVLTPSQVTPPAPDAAPPLVASIPIADTPLRLGVTYLPERDEMLVSASGLAPDGVHDHELWLVPSDGSELRSLGVVVPGEERRVALDPALAALIGDGSQMVLTREPLGGKPEGEDAGPVVAEGAFSAT